MSEKAQKAAEEIARLVGLYTITVASHPPENYIRDALAAADETKARIAAIIDKHFVGD